MKKFFYVLMVGVALVGLSACSSTNSGNGAKSQAPADQSTPATNAEQSGEAGNKTN